jgi:hypothetical protein
MSSINLISSLTNCHLSICWNVVRLTFFKSGSRMISKTDPFTGSRSMSSQWISEANDLHQEIQPSFRNSTHAKIFILMRAFSRNIVTSYCDNFDLHLRIIDARDSHEQNISNSEFRPMRILTITVTGNAVQQNKVQSLECQTSWVSHGSDAFSEIVCPMVDWLPPEHRVIWLSDSDIPYSPFVTQSRCIKLTVNDLARKENKNTISQLNC